MRLTFIPSLRDEPASGSVRITRPSSTVSLASDFSSPISKLAFLSFSLASATVCPATFGISTVAGVLDTIQKREAKTSIKLAKSTKYLALKRRFLTGFATVSLLVAFWVGFWL